jgi:hypothetical protein
MFCMNQAEPRQSKISVVARFSSSRAFSTPDTTVPNFQFDEFRVDPLPSEGNRQDAILSYEFKHTPKAGSPFEKIDLAQTSEGEARIFLASLSVVAASDISFHGALVNGESTLARGQAYRLASLPPVNFDDVKSYYDKLAQLRLKDRGRFVNSARAFQSALSLLDSNPTVSFFMLVVAIECLSNYVLPPLKNESKRERFVRFVETYLHQSLGSEKSDISKFRSRLDTAYRMRNAFVHGGQLLHPAVYFADRLARPSVLYFERKQGRRAPGLLWLEKIVRGALLGFLEARVKEVPNKPRRPLFRNLPGRLPIARFRVRVSVKKGQPMTADMLDLD